MYQLFSIRDNKTGVYQTPMSFKHSEEALRALKTLMREKNSSNPLVQFAEDYSIYKMCMVDEVTGEVHVDKTGKPVFLENLIDLKENSND
jgi:hypothetical protein